MAKRAYNKKPTKAKVHVVMKTYNSPYSEDIEIVKVFKGTRKRAANKYAEEQEKASIEYSSPNYLCYVETWEVE